MACMHKQSAAQKFTALRDDHVDPTFRFAHVNHFRERGKKKGCDGHAGYIRPRPEQIMIIS
jgi:hypothetical protein